jgi:hypothetical protein
VGARKITGLHVRALWVAGFAVWGVALAAGFHQAMGWEFRAGKPALSPSAQTKPLAQPLLIVALHSQCPCSLATVENLTALTPVERAKLRILFVFTGPNPHHSATFEKAAAIPEAEKAFLSEKEVFERYGARTSGQALLYDRAGRLVFSGGLTESRGVAGGESEGMRAIQETLRGHSCIKGAPVYGCPLQSPR